MLTAAGFKQVRPFDKVEVRANPQKQTQTISLSFTCWSILSKHMSPAADASGLTEEDLANELQQDILSTLANTDALWLNDASSLFRWFNLPGSRAGMKRLLRKRDSEQLIPALLPLFNTSNDSEAMKIMQQMVHLDTSHLRLITLCEQLVNQQAPHHDASDQVRFLASYCLLQHQKKAAVAAVVDSVASGVAEHSDWLDCFGDAVIGTSPLTALKLLSHSAAVNALVGLADSVRADHPASNALVSALLSMFFTAPAGDPQELRDLPILTAATLAAEQQRVVRAILQCTRPPPHAGRRFADDLYQCRQYMLPIKRQQLQAMFESEDMEEADEGEEEEEGRSEEEDADDVEDEMEDEDHNLVE